MTLPRRTTGRRVGALIRRVEASGGFATVLARGDSTSGAALLICAQRGVNAAILEQVLGSDGRYAWRAISKQVVDNEDVFKDYLTKRRRSDPDLWLIELDVPDAERFVAEMARDG